MSAVAMKNSTTAFGKDITKDRAIQMGQSQCEGYKEDKYQDQALLAVIVGIITVLWCLIILLVHFGFIMSYII